MINGQIRDKEVRVISEDGEPVSYTHLDVYKRQLLDRPVLR